MREALDSLIALLGSSSGPGGSEPPSPDPGKLLELATALGPAGPLALTLLQGAAPRESLLALHRLASAGSSLSWPEEPRAVRAVASILSSGPELARWIARRPGRLELLLDPQLGRALGREELKQDLERRLVGVNDAAALAESIAGFRNDHYLRLAAGEFGLASLEQVGRELAELADVCLDRALRFAVTSLSELHGPPLETESGAQRPCGLAAIGMGKYGAQELNFCSDIDVVFIYRSDEGQAGALTLHEFFARVCQLVTKVLSEPTPEGYSFRVDLRLRPEGSRGPICNSLGGAERYYETWGGPYDRLAWLKARPAAGDLELGEHMVQLLRPFVYPRAIRPEVLEHIQELNRRLQSQHSGAAASRVPDRALGGDPRSGRAQRASEGSPRRSEAGGEGWNVKLGSGGIREVEFFVQALQLLHAGKRPALQERSTLRALNKLLFAGLISEQEHRVLGESYELWRHLEHRLQLHEGRQTHFLPAGGPLRARISAHLGLPAERLDQEIERRRVQVSAIYHTLGVAPFSPEEELLAPVLDPDLPDDSARRLLGQAGFTEAGRALEQLQLLASKPWGPFSPGQTAMASRLSLPLLAELARSPDPDAALLHFVELTLRVGPYQGLWTVLEQNRPVLRLLCSVLGSSDYLARLLIRRPELLDRVLIDEKTRASQTRDAMRAELQAGLATLEPSDIEGRLEALGRFRHEQVLRVGLSDIAGGLEQEQVWDQLSGLAELVLEQIYPLVLSETAHRYGLPRTPEGELVTLSIIGLGKLGARELTYASDLDLIFIYAAEGTTDGPRPVGSGEFFARVVQRLIRALSTTFDEGSLYQVDTRLRPSGQQGTLVSSLLAFQQYHAAAQTWERQVLIKARPVGGDAGLGQAVQRWIQSFVYSPASEDTARRDIHRLRERMEKELAEEQDGFYNLKLGRGGLLDIEFVVQYLQLRHGPSSERLRVLSTLAALEALTQLELIPRDDAAVLSEGYRFLRRTESRLRLVRDRSASRLPASPKGLEVMARRLGYREQAGSSAGERLLADYRGQTAAIRGVYRRILGEA